MSGLFPDDIPLSVVEFGTSSLTFVSESHSGVRNVSSGNVQRWVMRVETAILKESQWRRLLAFIVNQDGQYETFTIIPRALRKPLSSLPSGLSPLVKGASQTGTNVLTDGWPASTLIYKAGDLVKFANHNKAYMLTADVTSDGSGNATLPIKPALLTSPADNSAITYQNVPITVAFTDDMQGIQMQAKKLGTFSGSLREVINL